MSDVKDLGKGFNVLKSSARCIEKKNGVDCVRTTCFHHYLVMPFLVSSKSVEEFFLRKSNSTQLVLRVQGWRSDESARLLPMWLEFDTGPV